MRFMQDRPADGARRDVAVGRVRDELIGLGDPGGGNHFDAQAAGQAVGARAGDGVGDEAGRASELRADAGALHVEFDDVELVDFGGERPEARVGDVDAVDQIGVVLAAAAGGGRERVVLGDAGNQLEQARVGARERQRFDGLGGVVEIDLGGLEVDGRRRGADLDVFLDRHAEHEIDLRVLVDLDDHRAGGGGAAGLRDFDRVLPGEQRLEVVGAVAVGLRRASGRQAVAGDLHRRAGQRLSPLIEHEAGHRTGIGREQTRAHARDDRQSDREPPEATHVRPSHPLTNRQEGEMLVSGRCISQCIVQRMLHLLDLMRLSVRSAEGAAPSETNSSPLPWGEGLGVGAFACANGAP